eukprot:jgi/Botrbrau1/14734/Bobra.0108s0078.1
MGQFGDSAQGEALETANQPGPPPNAPPNAKEMGHVSDPQFSWEEQNKKAARHRSCVHMSSPSSIGVSSPLSLSKIALLPRIRVEGQSLEIGRYIILNNVYSGARVGISS